MTAEHSPPALRFDAVVAETAASEWRFNCGPAALCAIAGLTPSEVRPHMGDFETKAYTNPTLMYQALRSLGVKFTKSVSPLGDRQLPWPTFGLARIQWGGPWTDPGVPVAARYRKTHWVASCVEHDGGIATVSVFDVNAVGVGGWLSLLKWADRLVPWLLRECVPKANGKWWVTHTIETERR